jgi:hypothetical protein
MSENAVLEYRLSKLLDDLLFLQDNYTKLYVCASSFKISSLYRNFRTQTVKLTQPNENAQIMNESFIYIIKFSHV